MEALKALVRLTTLHAFARNGPQASAAALRGCPDRSLGCNTHVMATLPQTPEKQGLQLLLHSRWSQELPLTPSLTEN